MPPQTCMFISHGDKMKLKTLLVLFALLCSSQHVYAGGPQFTVCLIEAEEIIKATPLKGKVLLMDTDDSDLDGILTNKRKPIAAELETINAWAEHLGRCEEEEGPLDGNTIAQIKHSNYKALQSLVFELGKGKLTFGQFAMQRRNIDNMAEARTHEESGKILGQLQHSLEGCIDVLKYDVELKPISDKVALSGIGEQTFGMLANENHPTLDETQAIFRWATKREQCIRSNPPQNSPITQANMEGFNAAQSLILDLYKGSITYGQFARQRQEIAKMVDAKTQQIIGQYQQQQAQQQQYQQQQEDYLHQACLNRARSQSAEAACNMERSGRQMGRAIGNILRE